MSDKKPAAFQVIVNDFEFTLTQEEIDSADFLQVSETDFHLLHHQQSFTATLLKAAAGCKRQVLRMEGENYTVQINDELDQMLSKMGYSTETGKQVKEIKAPMPGLVLHVDITAGQPVNEGDKLLVLVAMKMENSILSPVSTTIKKVAVENGQAVDKGQLLIELE